MGLRTSSSSKVSYANALKAKPQDWHLEFSMDDHALPLDLTIYGAMHQHEMRKINGPVSSALIWQGVYTVKFKKVSGPLPTAADSTWIHFCMFLLLTWVSSSPLRVHCPES